MMIKRMIWLLSLIIIVGCGNNNDFSGSNKIKNDCPPEMFAIINDQKHELEMSNYMCERTIGLSKEVEMTDALPAFQIAEEVDPIPLKPMSIVQFNTIASPKINVFLWDSDGNKLDEIPLQNGNQFILPKKEGKYIYEAVGNWSNAEVEYLFYVQIE